MKLKNFVGLIASLLTVFFVIVFGVGFFCGASYEQTQLAACIGYRTFFGSVAPEELWLLLMAINLLMLPSMITVPMQDVVFNSWKRFAVWTGLIVLIPSASLWSLMFSDGGSYGIGGMYDPLVIHFPIALLFLWYLISSLTVILYARHRDRLNLEIKLKSPIIASTLIFFLISLSYWMFLVYNFDFTFFN